MTDTVASVNDDVGETRCPVCGAAAPSDGPEVITLIVGRREHLVSYEGERVFQDSQEYSFCTLAHANTYLASHPIRDDAWQDSYHVGDVEGGLVGDVVFGCVVFLILGSIPIGLFTIGRWVIGLF